MEKSEILKKIDGYLKENREKIVKDLRRLVKIPSLREEATREAPFGEPCLEALKEALSLFRENGFSGELSEDRKYALATYGNGGKTIGLFGHTDVVAADGEWLLGEPFSLTERDGCLVGRGCEDDKGGVIASLYAAKMIRDLKLPLSNRLLFFIGSAEETGMEDVDAFVGREKLPDLSIIPDGEFPFSSGEKGRITVLLESIGKLKNVKDLHGGKCYNIVLDRLDVEYESGEKETVLGVGTHASTPEGSENALVKFANAAEKNRNLSDADRAVCHEISDLFSDSYGTSLKIDFLDPVFGKTTCTNGIVQTCDKKVRLTLDIRYGISQDGEKILQAIREKTRGKWKILSHTLEPGYDVDGNSPAALALLDAYRNVTGDGSAEGFKMACATYARKLGNAFSVGVCVPQKGEDVPFLPAGHGSLHQPDERMSADGFLQGIKVLTLMILSADGTL